MKHAYYHIIEQYGEQASFLWESRFQAVNEPHYTLDDLSELDRRIDAHLDALLLSGNEGIQVCDALLKLSEPGGIFTAVCIALLKGDEKLLQLSLEQVPTHPQTIDGLIGALHAVPLQDAKQALEICSRSDELYLRAAATGTYGARRMGVDPALLKSLLDSESSDLQCRALQVIGELKLNDSKGKLTEFITSDSPLCSFHASTSAVLLGIDSARKRVLTLVSDKTFPLADSAAHYAVRGQSFGEAKGIWEELLNNPVTVRPGLIALGAAGFADNIEILFKYMNTPEHARVCGEMVSIITGVDIAHLDLHTLAPSDYVEPLNDDPADNNVALSTDEFLPWPDVKKVQHWWAQNKSFFEPGVRYLAGKKIDNQSLRHVLRYGLQSQRQAAALELVLCKGTPALFNIRAPSKEQFTLLAQL